MASRAVAVWQRRTVLGLLVKRDFKSKYEGSWLGYAWSLLEPLLLTALYWVVFTQILDLSGRLAGAISSNDPAAYGLFLIAGILPWLWFSSCVSGSTRALMRQSKLITSMGLPRELFGLQHAGTRLVEFFASVFVLPIFALIAWRTPHLAMIPAGLFAVVLQMVLLTGITLILSSVTVLVRDVQRVIRVSLRATFYLSPILYSAQVVEDRLGRFYDVYKFNPLATILQLHRAVWFPETFPSPAQLLSATVISVAVLVVGWRVFHVLEPAVLKEL